MRAALLLSLISLSAACSQGTSGAVDIAVIGDSAGLTASGTRLAAPGALVRSATTQGLVRLDEAGQLVPGIAERWIVTDDGESYIFRVREIDLAGGKRLDARAVQQALTRTLRSLSGTTLGLDLAQVRDVRAMTGRVIEIRLKSPMPGFLQLLAQPELGVIISGNSTGPMVATRAGDDTVALTAMPPETRGMPAQPDWADTVRTVRLTAADARTVTARFSDGSYSLVLGGTLPNLPLVDVGPLSRGTVRLDSALGLFGLDVVRAEGFLATPANREAIAMALDRPALIAPFNVAGWVATTRIVAPGLPDDRELVQERWASFPLEARRATAAGRVAAWRAANGGGAPVISIALPEGPGSDTLFGQLSAQLREIGIVATRAEGAGGADLVLRDRVARYAGARWFLNQFNCRMSEAICSPDADTLVQMAVESRDPAQQAAYLADAENALAANNGYIPIGAPIRWSLVRSRVVGFAENAWAIHPLFPFTRAPI